MADTRTPLGELHEKAGATLVRRGEFEVPASFTRPESEYQAMRKVAGIIDLCAAPRFKLQGVQRVEALDFLATINVEGIGMNRARAGYLCNEHGGVVDEVIILKTEQYLLVQGTSTDRAGLNAWVEEHLREFDVEFVESTTTQGCIEVRGPMARTILDAVLLDGSPPPDVGSATICAIGQARCLVTRRRHANMDSYLLHTGAFFLQPLWERLSMTGQNMGAAPVGWNAQEILRIEAGIPGFGTEIDSDTTPMELGTANRLDFSKDDYLGRRALMHQSCAEFSRRMVALRFEAAHPLERDMLLEFESMPVGRITSATTLPNQRVTAALGFVDALKSQTGSTLQARARTHVLSGKVVDPFTTETPAG